MIKTDTFLSKGIYYSLIGYCFFSTISLAGGNIATSLGSLLAFILCLTSRDKIFRPMPKNFFIYFGIFILSFAISALFAYDSATAFERILKNTVRMIALFLAVFFIKERRQALVLICVIGISATMSSLYAIWQGIWGNYRALGFSSHPMIMAGYLIQVIPLFLILSLEETNISRKLRYAFGCVTLLSLIALLFNGTRGAWIAIIIVLIVYLGFTLKKILTEKRTLIIVLSTFILFSGILATTPTFRERFITITDLKYQSNSERILLWRSALNMFSDHPLTGVGGGNFGKLYKTKYILPEAKERKLSAAHNTFLHVLAETGIIGIIGFLSLFGFIVTYAIKNYRESEGNPWPLIAILVTLSFFIQGLTEYNYGNTEVIRLYWMIIGLVFISTREEKFNIKEGNNSE